MELYRKRVEAFGFNAIVVDGHDVEELVKAFHEAAQTKGKPTAILAKTFKGKNFVNIEDLDNWHGKAIVGDQGQDVLKVYRFKVLCQKYALLLILIKLYELVLY